MTTSLAKTAELIVEPFGNGQTCLSPGNSVLDKGTYRRHLANTTEHPCAAEMQAVAILLQQLDVINIHGDYFVCTSVHI